MGERKVSVSRLAFRMHTHPRSMVPNGLTSLRYFWGAPPCKAVTGMHYIANSSLCWQAQSSAIPIL